MITNRATPLYIDILFSACIGEIIWTNEEAASSTVSAEVGIFRESRQSGISDSISPKVRSGALDSLYLDRGFSADWMATVQNLLLRM
jgi:hypothetical protein